MGRRTIPSGGGPGHGEARGPGAGLRVRVADDVAALAGLPAAVIARARSVLTELEQQKPLEPPEQQLGLPMELAPDPLRKELEDLEPDSLSPLEALQKLYELRSRLHS